MLVEKDKQEPVNDFDNIVDIEVTVKVNGKLKKVKKKMNNNYESSEHDRGQILLG